MSVPLSFEPNQGQLASTVQFVTRGSGYALFLTPGAVVLNLERQPRASAAGRAPTPAPASADTLCMGLIGSNPKAHAQGLAPQPGVVSYFIGNDPARWRTGIPTYGKVNYAQVYPGVDLVFYGNRRQLEYDFVVAPGADAGRIAWRIAGARAGVDAEGNLTLRTPNGPAGFKKPVVYQLDGDTKTSVDASFAVAGNVIGQGLITTPGAFQTTSNDSAGCCYHGFVAKITPDAGVFLDGKIVGDPANGAAFRNAVAGDTIQLFATGLAASQAGTPVSVTPVSGVTVNLGSTTITPSFAGLVAPGEFQVNFTVPQTFASLASGLYHVSITVNGVTSPATINSSPPGPVVIPIGH